MKVLMCRPDYFEIKHKLNPWMDLSDTVDCKKALSQWQQLHDVYRDLGIAVELIGQSKDLPDMTFTANAGIVQDGICISGNPKPVQRRGEIPVFQKWFTDHDYTVETISHHFSGEGDALFFRGTLYMGYGFRSERESHREIAGIFGVPTIPLRLINPYFYDFDTAFCPIGDKAVFYYPGAFDEEGRLILENIDGAIPMTKAQAQGFVGNSVYSNGKLLVSFLDDDLKKTLKKLQIEPIFLNMSEFKKSGGGIKCLTLYL